MSMFGIIISESLRNLVMCITVVCVMAIWYFCIYDTISNVPDEEDDEDDIDLMPPEK